MLFLFLFLVFLISAAALWFQGFWNCLITFINLIFAGLVAMSFYEPLAGVFPNSMDAMADFVGLWGVFIIAFGVFRIASDMLCRDKVVFNMPVEMTGRSIMAIWTAWVFICFTCMSLHMAPLGKEPFNGGFSEPMSASFLGLSPDRQWLAFTQSRSTGALSGDNEFDPKSTFVIKFRQHRVKHEGGGSDSGGS